MPPSFVGSKTGMVVRHYLDNVEMEKQRIFIPVLLKFFARMFAHS
jgi:hypothetical protein